MLRVTLRHLRSLLTCALVALCAWAAFGANPAPAAAADPTPPDYSYWFAYAQTKIYPSTAAPASATLASDATSPVLAVTAARAEFEGRQIAVRALGARLQDVWIEPSALTLTDASGTVATIPAADVTAYKVGYVNVTHPSYGVKAKGLQPDPLLPMTLANGLPLGWRPGGVIDVGTRAVAAGSTQPFYVSFQVPGDAVSGTYTGTLVITCSDATGAQAPRVVIPISLTVYPFSVAQRTLKTSFGFEEGLARYFNDPSGTWLSPNSRPSANEARMPESTWYAGDQIGGWLQYMSDHRVTSQWIGPAWSGGPAGDGSVTARPDVLADYLGTGPATTLPGDRLAFNTVKLPWDWGTSWLLNPFTSSKATAMATRYYQTVASALGSNVSKALVYPIDEPSYSKRSVISKYAALVHRAIPGAKYLLTTDAKTERNKLVSGVDIYVYRLHFFFRDATYIKKIRAAHKEVWIYGHRTEWQKVTPNYLIDKPLTDERAEGWFAFKTRATGLLYYKIDKWKKVTGGMRDPYAEPLSTLGSLRGHPLYSNGDGSLVYPGYYPALGLDVQGAPPVGSLRMEALRDGLEDYEYVKLVAAKYGTAAADSFVARIIGAFPKAKGGVLKFPTYQSGATAYETARAAMAAKLSQ